MKNGWPETTLEAVIVLNRSGYWGDEFPSDERPCEVKVIRNADLTKSGMLRGHAARYFSKKEVQNAAFQRNDVAMSSSGDVGKIWEVDAPDFFASNFVRILRPNPKLIAPGFLPLALSTESVRCTLAENTVGSTIQNLQKGFYSSAKFALPPLDAQQRLVDILNEAFASIATAKAKAEKNLQNARALLESHLQFVFTQRGKGWMEKPLGVVCDFSQGVQVDVKLQTEIKKDGSQVRFLRIVDFTQGNEPERYIDNPGKKFLVCQSDISLVRYGASTGFVCRGLEGAIANNLFRVIPKEDQVSNAFLYWFLKSPAFQDEIKKIMNGAAMPAISFGVINEIAVAFPPPPEQPMIVSQLDSFVAETQRLASLYERKLAALEALKKSLLHQAFTGEL